MAFCATAFFAWLAASVDWRCIVLRSSTSFSSWIRRLAKASAVLVYWAALVASPLVAAWSAIFTAWTALPLTFSSSAIVRLSRISVCFWWAMTLAACSLSRRCWSCASASACSSWIFGSALSLKSDESFAVKYFHHRRNSFNMASTLGHGGDSGGGDLPRSGRWVVRSADRADRPRRPPGRDGGVLRQRGAVRQLGDARPGREGRRRHRHRAPRHRPARHRGGVVAVDAVLGPPVRALRERRRGHGVRAGHRRGAAGTGAG